MADQPNEKPTVELPAVPAWAVELKMGIQELSSNVRGARADIALVSNDLSLVKDRVGSLEKRADDVDKRANNNSMRAQQNTDEDLQRAAETAARIAEERAARESELAKEREAREALAAKLASVEKKTDVQTEILGELKGHATGLLNNRAVKALGYALLTAATLSVTGWVATHQGQPAPVPPGYQLVPVDGGAR